MAFNFGNNPSFGAATHWDDDVGWGTPPTAGPLHHLVYTYSSNVVRVYIDGVLANTRTLGAALNTFADEPINIGCQRDSANGARSFHFTGTINTVRVHGGSLPPSRSPQTTRSAPAAGSRIPRPRSRPSPTRRWISTAPPSFPSPSPTPIPRSMA
jgi:hypothetical protein